VRLWLIQNQKLRVAGDRLAPALCVAIRQQRDRRRLSKRGPTFGRSVLEAFESPARPGFFGSSSMHANPTDSRDPLPSTRPTTMFSRCHLVSHEVLKYHANFVMQILDGITRKSTPSRQDLTLVTS